MRNVARLTRKGSGVIASLSTPCGDIKKEFPESELRQERRRAMCWIEKTGRDVWGSQWSQIKKIYEA